CDPVHLAGCRRRSCDQRRRTVQQSCRPYRAARWLADGQSLRRSRNRYRRRLSAKLGHRTFICRNPARSDNEQTANDLMNTMRGAFDVEGGSTGTESGNAGMNAMSRLFGAESGSTGGERGNTGMKALRLFLPAESEGVGMKTLRVLSALLLLAGLSL